MKLDKHPPERRGTPVVLACAGCGCCCCCCCCIHSAASLVGAGVATARAVSVAATAARVVATTRRFVRCKTCGHVAPHVPEGAATCAKCGRTGPIVVAISPRPIEEEHRKAEESRGSRRFAAITTWAIVALGVGATGLAMDGYAGWLVAGIFFPVYQLVAALFALPVVAIAPLADRGAAVGTVGRILLGGVLGTLVGVALSVPILGGAMLIR